MKWTDWLMARMSDTARDEMPEEMLLMDEMYAMVEVARVAGVELPAMSRRLQQDKMSAYHVHNGSAAMPPEELVRKAMCVAGVIHLVEAGQKPEDARKFVADCANEKRVARWHKDYAAAYGDAGDDIVPGFAIFLHNQVLVFKGILHAKHNQMTAEDAVKELFIQ